MKFVQTTFVNAVSMFPRMITDAVLRAAFFCYADYKLVPCFRNFAVVQVQESLDYINTIAIKLPLQDLIIKF